MHCPAFSPERGAFLFRRLRPVAPDSQVGPGRYSGKRLGHTKISTTLNLYTHIFQDADDLAADALNASLSGGKSAG
jgi:hypothetical protein